MNEEENQLKINMASHDFYSDKCLEAEGELLDLLESLESKEDLDEELGKNIIRKGQMYLNLSIKFMQELDRMEEFAPKLGKALFKDKVDNDIFKFYIQNLKGVRATQTQVHNQLQTKINLIEKLINENGYGSYD